MYRCHAADGALLYIGATNSWTQRRWHHRTRSPWWPEVSRVSHEPYPNRDSAQEAEQAAIRAERPLHNKERYGGTPPGGSPALDLGEYLMREHLGRVVS